MSEATVGWAHDGGRGGRMRHCFAPIDGRGGRNQGHQSPELRGSVWLQTGAGGWGLRWEEYMGMCS